MNRFIYYFAFHSFLLFGQAPSFEVAVVEHASASQLGLEVISIDSGSKGPTAN